MRLHPENEFKIKFDGEQQQIDANTLIHALLGITNIIQEVNRELSTGRQIDIKVQALHPGSFIVDLVLLATEPGLLAAIVSTDNVKLVSDLIKALTDLLNLKKILQGEPPKKVEEKPSTGEIVVTNNRGSSVAITKPTYNIYINNQPVQNELSRTFSTLEGDPAITGIEIKGSDESPLFVAEREEFPALAAKSEIVKVKEESKVITQRTRLNIVRLSFEQRLKWEFLYQGIRISALIADEGFTARIDRGDERFAKGDVLDVDLQIVQVLDTSIDAYENKSYEIIKVHQHIQRTPQPQLFERPRRAIDLSED